MGVAVGDVDTLMSHTLRDGQGGKAHVDQQTDVAMSQIVYANPFYPCLLAAAIHFPMEIAFADGEHPAVRLHAVKLLEVILQLITEKLRDLDHPVALGRFLGGDDILLVEPLVRLVNGESALLKVKVCRGQGQQLSLPDVAPLPRVRQQPDPRQGAAGGSDLTLSLVGHERGHLLHKIRKFR